MVGGALYETPAERKLLALLGADAVGMSTVPEAVAARAGGAAVLALSVITNVAGQVDAPSHTEVASVSGAASRNVARLLAAVIAATR